MGMRRVTWQLTIFLGALGEEVGAEKARGGGKQQLFYAAFISG
jgi:hypothetical protein